MPGRLVRRSDYMENYDNLIRKDGVPFVPHAVWKDVIFSGAILLSICACAVYFGPFGPSGQPDPTIIGNSSGGASRTWKGKRGWTWLETFGNLNV
jgi:ubiquinol-cytochrome c reductase cytochrome b subunit